MLICINLGHSVQLHFELHADGRDPYYDRNNAVPLGHSIYITGQSLFALMGRLG